jgi:DNA-binding transcriptional regulator YiaG
MGMMDRSRVRREAGQRALRLPRVDSAVIRRTRMDLGLTRVAFADRLGINRRTLERWEQGRSQPGHEASALILLVQAFRDTLDRLASLEKGRQRPHKARTARRGLGSGG